MTFPPSNASIIRNEVGEPVGWDIPSDEPYEPDDFDREIDDAAGRFCMRMRDKKSGMWTELFFETREDMALAARECARDPRIDRMSFDEPSEGEQS